MLIEPPWQTLSNIAFVNAIIIPKYLFVFYRIRSVMADNNNKKQLI